MRNAIFALRAAMSLCSAFSSLSLGFGAHVGSVEGLRVRAALAAAQRSLLRRSALACRLTRARVGAGCARGCCAGARSDDVRSPGAKAAGCLCRRAG